MTSDAASAVEVGCVAAGQSLAVAAGANLRRLRLELAVEGWVGGASVRYGPGLGLLLALLQLEDPMLATRLHDANRRKPLAAGPLRLTPWSGELARAELTIATWDAELGEALQAACRRAVDHSVAVLQRPGCLLRVEIESHAELGDLLGGQVPESVFVRFATPTFFSQGRMQPTPGARSWHRYALLPTPGLVVGSWLRAWREAGGATFGAEATPTWLDDRIAIRRVESLSTTVVHADRTALTGFVGDVAFAWQGAEPWGPRLLSALARFGAYCGTGAKTSQGFGQTILVEVG